MNGKHYVGFHTASLETYSPIGPITGIALIVDENNEYRAGTADGYLMEIECPYGTQTMANNLLASLAGKTYYGYRADDAALPIGAELGDGITVGGMYSMLAYRSVGFGPGHMSEIAAPSENELEHEYPYQSQAERQIERSMAKTRSLISKTAEEILLEVRGKLGEEDASAMISTAISGITMSVTSKDGSTTFTLTGGGAELSTQTLDLSVNAVNISGKLTASQIDATELKVSAANITGSLVIGQLPEDVATTLDIPSNLSDLTNDVGFITDADIPTKTSDLTNDSGFTSLTSVQSYINNQGYQNASGVVSIINGTVTADYINALGVTAAYLQGNIISIGYGNSTFGYLYPGTNSEDTTALTLTGVNALRFHSGGDIYMENSSGQFLQLGGANGLCYLGGGPFAVGSKSYGSSLPSSGTYGQVYFLLE